MDAIKEFKKAACAMQQDERYLRLAAARKANDEDEGLQGMIGQFNLTRLELNHEMEKDERDNARIAELNEQINKLYAGIMAAPTMLAYNEAKQEIKPLVNHINAIVAAAVDGDDPMLVEEPVEACGAEGCAGCSGCG